MKSDSESDETDAAKAVMVEQCPDASERRAVLNRLLATADAAGAVAPNAWAVTLFADGFRLNVGQVEAVVFAGGQLRVNLSGSQGAGAFTGSNFVASSYQSLPQPLCAFVGTPQEYLGIADKLEPAHREFVRLAATTKSGDPRKGTSFSRSHCEALVEYARTATAEPHVPSA